MVSAAAILPRGGVQWMFQRPVGRGDYNDFEKRSDRNHVTVNDADPFLLPALAVPAGSQTLPCHQQRNARHRTLLLLSPTVVMLVGQVNSMRLL